MLRARRPQLDLVCASTCVCVLREGGGGVDLGPINSGRLSYDPRVPPGLAGSLEINGGGPITQDGVWISELSTNQRVTESDTGAINLLI